MHILVVEANKELGQIWCNHLKRQGETPVHVTTEDAAIEALRFTPFDVLVLNLMQSSALRICDYAAYRLPEIAIIIVSASNFFSDGSLFELIPNVRGMLHSPVQPDDLAAVIEHYGRRKSGLRPGP